MIFYASIPLNIIKFICISVMVVEFNKGTRIHVVICMNNEYNEHMSVYSFLLLFY